MDGQLLASAREPMSGVWDARVMDEALAALGGQRRSAEIGLQYKSYRLVPLDAPVAGGDLEFFLSARRDK